MIQEVADPRWIDIPGDDAAAHDNPRFAISPLMQPVELLRAEDVPADRQVVAEEPGEQQ